MSLDAFIVKRVFNMTSTDYIHILLSMFGNVIAIFRDLYFESFDIDGSLSSRYNNCEVSFMRHSSSKLIKSELFQETVTNYQQLYYIHKLVNNPTHLFYVFYRDWCSS